MKNHLLKKKDKKCVILNNIINALSIINLYISIIKISLHNNWKYNLIYKMELAPTRLWWPLICVGDAWPLKDRVEWHRRPRYQAQPQKHSQLLSHVHRDLKPENILLSGYWKACLAKIKLICFSICTCKKKISLQQQI